MSNMPTIKKIGKYAANLSKSIAISTVKAIPSKAPNMRSFVEETASISKDIYASVSGFRNKIKS